MMRKILFCLLVFGLAACKTYSDDELQSFDKQIEAHISKKGIDCDKSPSGLYFKLLRETEGRSIKYTDIVSFTYTGKLLDGTIFDKQDTAVTFEIKELIGAWKEMLLMMREGEKAYLIAPPQLGYGTHDLPDIPKNSILEFELEVTEVK